MANTKNQIIRDLNDHSDQIIFHLIYCYFWKNTTNNFNHWCQEIWSNINDLPRWKNTNKLPSYDQLCDWYLNTELEKINDYIDSKVISACYREKIIEQDIPKYNKSRLIKYIQAYFIWLIQILAEKGSITDLDVANKVKELLKI